MRKNLRGFTNHCQAIAEKLMADEFPILAKKIPCVDDAFINKCEVDFHSFGKDNGLAKAVSYSNGGGEALWGIHLNLDKRNTWLRVEDEHLMNLLRHEFLHAELREQGRPYGDFDIEFIKEAVERDIFLEQRHYTFFYSYHLERELGFLNIEFDRELFEYCFPNSFDYWANFAKYMRMKSSILQDVKIAHSTLTDSHWMAKGQFGTQGEAQ